MTFWEQVDAQLDKIETVKPDTFDGVRGILLDSVYDGITNVREFGPDAAFFAGSGGARSLFSALSVAGWVLVWRDASYYYGAVHGATGETLTYIEGDVLRGDAR